MDDEPGEMCIGLHSLRLANIASRVRSTIYYRRL
jgi:hypothetical protein